MIPFKASCCQQPQWLQKTKTGTYPCVITLLTNMLGKKNIVYTYIHILCFSEQRLSKPIMTFQHFPAMLVNCPSFHREISIDELLTGPPISLILAASVPLVPAPLESFLKTFCCAAWRKQSGKNPNALKTFHSTHLWLCR